jgi:hypothetical protein
LHKSSIEPDQFHRSAAKIIDSKEGDAVLDAPSGIVVVPAPSSDTATIYVASRLGRVINKYTYDFTSSALTASRNYSRGSSPTHPSSSSPHPETSRPTAS